MIAHLLHYDPYQEANQLTRRLFGQPEGQMRPRAAVRVPIDVREEDEMFVVEADVPGLAPEDLEIVAMPDRLTIKGARKATSDAGSLRRERLEYSFERVLQLPRGIDVGAVEASLEAGVLSVRLPKRPEDRPRTITVKPVASSAVSVATGA